MPPSGRGLTEAELAEFLATPVTARLATVKPDGAPYVVPVWQHWDGGTMFIIPRAGSRFVDHIRSEPRVAISCAGEGGGQPRALIEGTAEVVEGPVRMAGRMLDIANDMARRYMGPNGPDYLARTAGRPRYLLRVHPTRVTSWQGTEWHPRYLSG